eukprot:NODE_839_length_586_cov_265.703704_g829_i0.p2 GENE.NODE_839_length_586_cov_265.703704_g829_i0~~NODE_839_length_586_cov_265.703704_g829_i0.p2  ORF type:complete len:53 (+),score=7.28 NODE_839_length_586_cov_265.703704_g829_i0:209-367(+)
MYFPSPFPSPLCCSIFSDKCKFVNPFQCIAIQDKGSIGTHPKLLVIVRGKVL